MKLPPLPTCNYGRDTFLGRPGPRTQVGGQIQWAGCAETTTLSPLSKLIYC